jgi:hypothetical protein
MVLQDSGGSVLFREGSVGILGPRAAMSENLLGKIEWHKEHPEQADGMADKIKELQNLMSTELLRLPGIFERELQLKD